MRTSRRSPRPLGLALHRLRDELAPQTLLAEVQSCWSAVVGEVIAQQARPTAERAGVLTVSCTAAVWAAELDLMAPDILSRCNAALQGGTLTRLRCVTLPASAPPARPAPW